MATIEKRIGTNGDIRYRVRVRLRGEKPRARTFKRKTDADLWAEKVESDLGHGYYVPTTADRRRTLGELIDKFITEQLPIRQHRADERNIKRNLQWWKDNAGFVTLDKLTPQAIAGLRSQLLGSESWPRRRREAGHPSNGQPLPYRLVCGMQVGLERAAIGFRRTPC